MSIRTCASDTDTVPEILDKEWLAFALGWIKDNTLESKSSSFTYKELADALKKLLTQNSYSNVTIKAAKEEERMVNVRVMEIDTWDNIRMGSAFWVPESKLGKTAIGTRNKYDLRLKDLGGFAHAGDFYSKIALVNAATFQDLAVIYPNPVFSKEV